MSRHILIVLIVAATGCTLTVGHPPESSRLAAAETRAQIADQALQARADDLARAVAEIAKLPTFNEAANRVLVRNGYKPVKPAKLAAAPDSTPDPEPTPKEE